MQASSVPALSALSAIEARRLMTQGLLEPGDYSAALLAQVDRREPAVQAFTHLDPAHWRAQADACAARRGADPGPETAPLFGLPVGVKDVIDTADLPTEHGSVLHAGRRPESDATLVRRLRQAGGIVAGKTVTTELATYAPGKTRNPHHPGHTPGGSSSGSAAAVAAGMVPLAVGTQTGGSVIRPAAFCGVVGYKPSFGWISRAGVLQQSPSFDQVGVFGRDVDDVALLAQVLAGPDPDDPGSWPHVVPSLLPSAHGDPAQPPRLAFARTPHWSRMDADAQAAFAELVARLSGCIAERPLPDSAADAVGWHKQVMEAEIAEAYHAEYERGRDQLSTSLRQQIERGRTVTAAEHRTARDRLAGTASAIDSIFDAHGAILTPATLGTAPAGLASTGDSVMCVLWTAIGLPAISLPLLHGADGLPIGVQLVGRRNDDAHLLRTARWLMQRVREAGGAGSRGVKSPG